MAKFKVDPPGIKKREEKMGKDLDGDREKGESPAHRAKVLGSSKVGKGKPRPCKVCKGSHIPPHPHFK